MFDSPRNGIPRRLCAEDLAMGRHRTDARPSAISMVKDGMRDRRPQRLITFSTSLVAVWYSSDS